MPRVGFETTVPVFERVKTVHALDLRGHCNQQSDATEYQKLQLIRQWAIEVNSKWKVLMQGTYLS
jgi:hypothetical protein